MTIMRLLKIKEDGELLGERKNEKSTSFYDLAKIKPI